MKSYQYYGMLHTKIQMTVNIANTKHPCIISSYMIYVCLQMYIFLPPFQKHFFICTILNIPIHLFLTIQLYPNNFLPLHSQLSDWFYLRTLTA